MNGTLLIGILLSYWTDYAHCLWSAPTTCWSDSLTTSTRLGRISTSS